MVKSLVFSLASTFLSQWGLASSHSYTGSVALWVNGQKVIRSVELKSRKKLSLESDLVLLEKTPADFLPNERGCFCFSENDWRFAYVHAYFHATRFLSKLNLYLKGLGLNSIKKITVSLSPAPGYLTSGGSKFGMVYLSIPHPAFDPTIFAHELSHEIHQHIIGKNLRDVLSDALEKEDWDRAASQGLVSEGTANILAALITGEEAIGRYDYGDAAFRINSFVRLPESAPTLGQQFERLLKSPFIGSNYLSSIADLREMIKNPAFPQLMSRPSPYLASAAINQPLWLAAKTFGAPVILKIYLRTLAAIPNWQSHLELTSELINQAGVIDPTLSKYFQTEFNARGISIKPRN